MSRDENSDANPKDLASTIASWLKNVEHQGFLPTSYYDEFNSEEESSSEESESESEDESPYSQFLHFGKASQASMKRYSCILNLKDEFVVEDPFVEVKDEDIKSVETDFNDDGTRIIHLKNGLMLWGNLGGSEDTVLVVSREHHWKPKESNQSGEDTRAVFLKELERFS